jgi:LPXTG-site transpeptidase (sortase) family protein
MNRRRLLFTLGGGIAVLALAGALILQLKPKQHTSAQNQPPGMKDVVTLSTDNPDEAKPGSDYRSVATADEPKLLTMPSVGITGYIQKVGIDQHNNITAPNNINIAGWYVNSVKPGELGLSIIDGHVDGKSAKGIFHPLAQLKNGDQFSIQFGNDITKTFKVESVQQVAVADVPNVLYAHDSTIKSQLNLITCGGAFNRSTHQYEKRTIIVSSLIE